MPELDKEKVAKVLMDAGAALRSVTSERDKLASEVATLRRRDEAQKTASAMHSKGIHREVDYDTLVGNLEKAAEDGRLHVIKEAMEMVGPNMGSLGSLTSDDVATGGGNAFESFILGDVG